jgi:hypothetical protein
MTWAALVKLGLELPGVEEAQWYGTPALKVGGKGFARLKEDGKSVVLMVETVDAQQFLIQALPEVYFITDHYRGYPAVLARLSRLSVKEARLRLRQAWVERAPAKVRKLVTG